MTYSLIYTKTARGLAEVRARSAGLSPVARRVLIMIDGKRSEDELRLVVRDGELESALATLSAQGLIEECALTDRPESGFGDDQATVPLAHNGLTLDLGLPAEPAMAGPPTLRRAIAEADRRAAPAAPPPQAAATIVIRPTRSAPPPAALDETNAALEEAKRQAVRALYDRLGPYGEEPAARINDCKTHEALREQIRHAYRRISTFRGEPAARDYLVALGLR